MSSLYERRFQRSRLLSKDTIILTLRFFWVIVVIWCEFGVFFYSLSNCRWPDKVLQSSNPSTKVKPTRVLLISDARLQNPALSSWFGYDSNSAYLRRSWKVVTRLRPNTVIFLGDTLASGRYVTSDAEYDQYYRAFEATFPRNASVPAYFLPGNNDIVLGDSPSFSKDTRHFFETHFGPLNQVVSVSGYKFILLDAPGLVEEDYRRHAHGKTYDQWTPLPGGPIEFLQSFSDQEGHEVQPKILLSHIPLSRPSSMSCGPLREKGAIRAGAGQGYQAMLGKQTTEFLLKTLRPSVIFSGDNRDYCEVTHEVHGADITQSIREVTVKSFSPSRHIRRPGFQLVSLVPPSSTVGPSFADTPCLLPDKPRIFRTIYVPCLLLTAIVLLYLNIGPSRHRRRFSALSPISMMRSGRSSPPPEPESAIWATRTPLKSRIQTSPTHPLPLSARIPCAKSVPSYRASPITTPQGSPLLSPLTLFPSGDEGDAEDEIGPSQYSLRRDIHHSNGWPGEHGDEQADDRMGFEPPRRRAAPYFLPPPLSQYARQRGSCSWSFVFMGRRRRMTIALPDWKELRARFGDSPSNQRGPIWRFASDCVSIALPAVIAWTVIDWLFF